VHWGTFQLSDEALDEPPKKLAAIRLDEGIGEDEVFVLAIGETRRVRARGFVG
jgi:N-acyl-phosphatidylethanolamine-hydrolysing phospholipase D